MLTRPPLFPASNYPGSLLRGGSESVESRRSDSASLSVASLRQYAFDMQLVAERVEQCFWIQRLGEPTVDAVRSQADVHVLLLSCR